jgi:hypothetical protein
LQGYHIDYVTTNITNVATELAVLEVYTRRRVVVKMERAAHGGPAVTGW